MSRTQTTFEELRAEMDAGGVAAAFQRLAERLVEEKKYHELFDARLMQCRHELGLPVIMTAALDDLPDPQRSKLEEAYLAACREVGNHLLEEGRLRESWMYLRPTGESQGIVEALARVEVDEENIQDVIEVALNEGVDPRRGFELVLEHYGTCNAITTFEGDVSGRGPDVQQHAVTLLVRQLHREVTQNLRADIAQQEGSEPQESTLSELVAGRDWLFGEHNYHVDTTHLASVVRFARRSEDSQTLRLAAELTEYGRLLAADFQFEGEPPFADYYPSHRRLFRALLGEEVDEAVDYFRQQAESVDVEQDGALAVEVHIHLLAKAKRYDEAVDATIRLIPRGVPTTGFAPSLLELSHLSGNYAPLMEASESRGDVLSFMAGLVEGRCSL